MSELSPESLAAVQEVAVYSVGLVYCSACAPADMAVEDIEAKVNAQHPTGIASRWLVTDEPFSHGEPNPSPCSDGPLKMHYLLSC